MADLDVSAVITTLMGDLELEDPENGYELGKDSFSTRNVTYRKVEVSGDFTEGTDVDRSVRGNVTESLAVYVAGDTTYQFQMRVMQLTDALEQLAFTITRRVGDAQEVWNCVTSDYTVETSQEFLVAKIGLVRATINRKPRTMWTQVTP